MHYKTVTNISRRLVTFRCNSGQTLHLPPTTSVKLMEVDVVDNAKIKNLKNKGVLSESDFEEEEKSGKEKKSRVSRRKNRKKDPKRRR